ncbi:putative reverse transcriptase domain-containing protein [Tanacetum coccineum]|uniref:Reverse transcriptase domain-containing protein n=1 Tax=Tanacetum coccineum TaxID=301880 RepID=A0ABQ4Y540_9ASTR
MAASVIPISSDSSEESVGSHVPRVILFGAIPGIILVIHVIPAQVPIVPVDPLVAPKVGAVSVTSPAGVLDLVDYSSSSDSDPSEDSLPLAPELPLVSPFLCSDDSEADSESEPAEVTSRPSPPSGSSSHDTLASSSESPIALIRPGEAIPFGRPYRTHPNGPRKLLTARKRVGPFPARRLAWRRVSHRSSDRHSSPDFTSDSSSSGSPLDSLSDTSSIHSSGFDASGQTHSGPSTRVASSRLVYPPVMTLRYSEAFRRWRSLDSYSLSAGPSRKRCRSPTTSVPSSTPFLRSIAPTLADILPPRKRFRDSYSLEYSREDHMETGTADAEAIADLSIGDGVGAHTEDGIGMGVEIAASDIKEDEEEFETALEDRWRTLDLWLGLDVSPRNIVIQDMTITCFRMTPEAIEELIAQLVAKALANYEATHAAKALKAESDSQNGNDGDNGNGGNRNSRNKNRNHEHGGNNRNGNPNENGRGVMPVARVYTYQDFVKCQPLNFKGTEGVVGLTRWFEKMETVFYISNCPEMYQVKYATHTLLDSALTWWNSHKRTVGVDAAFAMTWRDLMKLMTEVYYPRNEIQNMETELMVLGEEDRIERYVGGLPNIIQGNVMSVEPTRLQDAIRLANSLMDQKLKEAMWPKPIRLVVMKVGVYVGLHLFCTSASSPCWANALLKCRVVERLVILDQGVKGHFKKDCPKLKNQNHGNKLVIPKARGKAYAIGGRDLATQRFLVSQAQKLRHEKKGNYETKDFMWYDLRSLESPLVRTLWLNGRIAYDIVVVD